MKNQQPQRVVSQTEIIHVEADGSDAWKTMDLVDILNRGGVGVLPTDTSYAFVTPLDSRSGLERLFRIREFQTTQSTTPLSILCSDLSTIDEFCLVTHKRTFKTLKSYLPGPYTFLLPSKTTNRGMLFDARGQKHAWKRQTLGVRIPDDPILRYLQDELLDGMPLVVSSLPFGDENDTDDDDNGMDRMDTSVLEPDASWSNLVDFIVHAGPRPHDGSTVYDMTLREPELLREGLGDLELMA
jgi:tRNA threonylcarbamoyl adenosine modification protein (Sua5/YciO/YrdC/YwlC family)